MPIARKPLITAAATLKLTDDVVFHLSDLPSNVRFHVANLLTRPMLEFAHLSPYVLRRQPVLACVTHHLTFNFRHRTRDVAFHIFQGLWNLRFHLTKRLADVFTRRRNVWQLRRLRIDRKGRNGLTDGGTARSNCRDHPSLLTV